MKTDTSELPCCDDCGIMLDNNHDLQRPVKYKYSENGCEPLRKRAKLEYEVKNIDVNDFKVDYKEFEAVGLREGRNCFI